MAINSNAIFFKFVCFSKGKEDPEHEEVDRACLSQELFKDPICQKTLLPLYFFLTREKENKMTVAEMKRPSGVALISFKKSARPSTRRSLFPSPVTRGRIP